MSKEEQKVQIYRVTYLRRDGTKAMHKLYQSKKSFDAQRKRRRYYETCRIQILCEVLNSDGVFQEIKDE